MNIDPKTKGSIRFIGPDKLEHTFSTAVNPLTGDRLTMFDSGPPTINDSRHWLQAMAKNIKSKSRIIECTGIFAKSKA